MSKSRRTTAKRATGSSSFGAVAARIDQLHAAARGKNSAFNGAVVTCNPEALFESTFRRHSAGPPPDHLVEEHRIPGLHAASSAQLFS